MPIADPFGHLVDGREVVKDDALTSRPDAALALHAARQGLVAHLGELPDAAGNVEREHQANTSWRLATRFERPTFTMPQEECATYIDCFIAKQPLSRNP